MDLRYTGSEIEAKLDKILLGGFNVLIDLENKNRIFVYEADDRIIVDSSKYSDNPNIKAISSFYDQDKKLGYVEFDNDITKIGNSGFLNNKVIKKVYLPKSVTKIETRAFGGSSLEYITGLDNVTEIGDSAFAETQISSIYIPNVEIIGSNAFYKTPIKNISLPNTLKEIKKQAFVYSSLESIELPSSVQKIGYYVFRENNSLKNVKINCVPTTDYDASYNDTEESDVGPFTNCFYGCENLVGVEFNTTLRSLGGRAFMDCSNLKYVKLPDTLEIIGKYAFYNCGSLTSIVFPESLHTIKDQAFFLCDIYNITLSSNISWVGVAAFWRKDGRIDENYKRFGCTVKILRDKAPMPILLFTENVSTVTGTDEGPFGCIESSTIYVLPKYVKAANNNFGGYPVEVINDYLPESLQTIKSGHQVIHPRDNDQDSINFATINGISILGNSDITTETNSQGLVITKINYQGEPVTIPIDKRIALFTHKVGEKLVSNNIELILSANSDISVSSVGTIDECEVIIPLQNIILTVSSDNPNIPIIWNNVQSESFSLPLDGENIVNLKIKCICYYDGMSDRIATRKIIIDPRVISLNNE